MNASRIAIRLIALSSVLVLTSCGGRQPATRGPAAAPPPEKKHWSYAGDTGPAAWGSLSPEDVACAGGTAQSPIDIISASAASAPERATLSVDHHEYATDILDNGHTIQVNCSGSGSVSIDGKAFQLVQFHFHSPSEHTVDGKSFPMEMHMVHKSADGALVVAGTLIEEGGNNAAFDALWANLPAEEGQDLLLPDVAVDVDKLLPADRTIYRYDGSLTTPPCSEGVKWLVLKTPIALSHTQIARFRAIIHDNNRPEQPLNGRIVALETLAGTP